MHLGCPTQTSKEQCFVEDPTLYTGTYLTVQDWADGVFQILPVCNTCGDAFVISALFACLSTSALQDRRKPSAGPWVFDHLQQMSLEGIAVFCISSHKCGRLKVIRARPEITVTEYNPCTESLKKERKRHTVSACGVVRGVARKPQDLKMHMT